MSKDLIKVNASFVLIAQPNIEACVYLSTSPFVWRWALIEETVKILR